MRRLILMHRLGLLGPLVRLQHRLDGAQPSPAHRKRDSWVPAGTFAAPPSER
jgi:hypothetical protein